MKTLLRHIISGLFIVVIVNATIINVPEDQPTIQACIDAATGGDTVLVDKGNYVENIKFNGKNSARICYFS